MSGQHISWIIIVHIIIYVFTYNVQKGGVKITWIWVINLYEYNYMNIMVERSTYTREVEGSTPVRSMFIIMIVDIYIYK